ncbi:MAG: hypothetical protein ACQERU_10465 [Bacteroidota bacterium]
MKNPTFFTVLFVFCTMTIFAQQNDSLFIQKKHVYQNGKRINKEELKAQLTSSPAGAVEYNKYKTKNTIASAATIVGSGFVLYLGAASLSNSLNDVKNLNEGNLETSDGSNLVFPAIATVSFVSIAAVLSLSAKDNLIKAVTIYNGNNKTGYKGNQKVEMGLTENGIGLTFRF